MMQTSLVTDIRNVPLKTRGTWNTKQCRAYQRILSGLTKASRAHHKIRIITLTSRPEAAFHAMNDRFQVLRKRIVRKFKSAFEYWKIKTLEGNGVMHIVYKGCFIPQKWLSKQWDEMHGSPIVFIQALRGKKRLARYLVSHYMARHHFERQSWSWGWVFRGFVGAWRACIKRSTSMRDAIGRWNWLLRQEDSLDYYKTVYGKKGMVRLIPFPPL